MNIKSSFQKETIKRDVTPEGVKQHFVNRYLEFAEAHKESDFNAFLQRHLYVVSATFVANDQALRRKYLVAETPKLVKPNEMKEFGRFYWQLVKGVMGRRCNKKRIFQPATYAFLDYKGSKAPRTITAANGIMRHIHALMLLHPENADAFRKRLQFESCLRVWPHWMDTLVIDPFDPNRASVEQIISYCMKGFMKTSVYDPDRTSCWHFFPQ